MTPAEARTAFAKAANDLLRVWNEDPDTLNHGYPEHWGSFDEEVYAINAWENTTKQRSLVDVDMILLGVNQMKALQ